MPINRKTVKRKNVPRKQKAKRVTKVIKSFVSQAIHKQIENKAIQYNAGFTIVNYADDNTMRAFPLSPGISINIPQDVTAGGRIGNRLKIVKAVFTYWMTPTVYNAVLNPLPKPLLFRMWIGYSKTSPTILPPIADLATLFQQGSSSAAPNGFIPDILRSTNKDKFVIYRDIKHKLGYSSITGSGSSAGNEYFANNDFKFNIMKKLDITKYLIKNVVYNDTTATPTTRGLFCWVQPVYADNTVTTGTIPANFNYYVDITYEDA